VLKDDSRMFGCNRIRYFCNDAKRDDYLTIFRASACLYGLATPRATLLCVIASRNRANRGKPQHRIHCCLDDLCCGELRSGLLQDESFGDQASSTDAAEVAILNLSLGDSNTVQSQPQPCSLTESLVVRSPGQSSELDQKPRPKSRVERCKPTAAPGIHMAS
jgi:hypothetical protein